MIYILTLQNEQVRCDGKKDNILVDEIPKRTCVGEMYGKPLHLEKCEYLNTQIEMDLSI